MHNEPLYTGKFSRMDIFIDFKMTYFVGEFVKTESLNLDDSVESLDELKNWMLANFSDINQLIAESKIWDYLTVYIGETFRKQIVGEWFIDLENKDNAYDSMSILTKLSDKKVRYTYVFPLTGTMEKNELALR